MFCQFRNLILIAIVGGCAFLCSPEPETAVANDRYWNNYWRWYDNDYRPYYNRNYHYRYDYNTPRQYGFRYDPYPYSSYYNRSYSPYYRDDHALRGRHNSVDVGPLHFDWR